MIDDILDYVNTYDDVRALLGVPDDELHNSTLALTVYRGHLSTALEAITGTYPLDSVEGDQTLVEIFSNIKETDSMHMAIQMYSTYVVADHVADTLPMIGVKTKSDGKSVVTRHSPESVYQDTRRAIKQGLSRYAGAIRDLFGLTPTDVELIRAVAPAVDVITGE